MHRKQTVPLPCAVLAVAVLLAAVPCSSQERSPNTDPRNGAVPLPSLSEEWRAHLVLDNDGVGVWTVDSFNVFEQFACPEIVGLDDKGRCTVLEGYSGRWRPVTTISDREWLGGLAFGDVDPRVSGCELYTGGKRGNLYQVPAYRNGVLDNRRIAHLPGREIHTIVGGDLDPTHPGKELLLFTRPGGLYRVSPTGPNGTFETKPLGDLAGRVRQAVVLPAKEGEAPEIGTVSRAGRFALLRITPDGPKWTCVYEAAMGKGRLALRPPRPGQPTVVYTTHDDGRILRHERRGKDAWHTETIYLGPQGPRGVVAGAFDKDPSVETVAVFGYSRRLEVLKRTPAGWQVETIFEDLDKGHWLATAELDGRNNTREIITSGYSGRVVLLSRPPGYGRPELADPADRVTPGPKAPPAK